MGSFFDSAASVLSGGLSDIVKGEDPIESIQHSQTLTATGGFSEVFQDDTFNVVAKALSGIFVTEALVEGLGMVKDELGEDAPTEAELLSPDMSDFTKTIMARQRNEEEEKKKKSSKKTKKGAKAQFKVDKTGTTQAGLNTDTTKTVGVQL